MTPYGPALAMLLRVPITDGGDLAPSLDRRVRLVVTAAQLAGVDPAELLAVCVMESGLRVRARNASLCGCQPYATDDATQATCAARSYAAGLDRCHTAEGAVSRYVWGRCEVSRGATPCRARWRAHVLAYVRSWGRLVATMRRGEDEGSGAEGCSQ